MVIESSKGKDKNGDRPEVLPNHKERTNDSSVITRGVILRARFRNCVSGRSASVRANAYLPASKSLRFERDGKAKNEEKNKYHLQTLCPVRPCQQPRGTANCRLVSSFLNPIDRRLSKTKEKRKATRCRERQKEGEKDLFYIFPYRKWNREKISSSSCGWNQKLFSFALCNRHLSSACVVQQRRGI